MVECAASVQRRSIKLALPSSGTDGKASRSASWPTEGVKNHEAN